MGVVVANYRFLLPYSPVCVKAREECEPVWPSGN